MGWTFTARSIEPDKKAFLDREFTFSSATKRHTIIKSAMVGSTYYAAAKVETDGAETSVYALIVLTKSNARASDGYTFGWKDMDEGMGPREARAPASILDLLTQARNDHARRWRRECRQHIAGKTKTRSAAKKLTAGTRIKFAKPIAFRDGTTQDTFDVALRQRRSRKVILFTSPMTGGLYRIPGAAGMDHEVVATTTARAA